MFERLLRRKDVHMVRYEATVLIIPEGGKL